MELSSVAAALQEEFSFIKVVCNGPYLTITGIGDENVYCTLIPPLVSVYQMYPESTTDVRLSDLHSFLRDMIISRLEELV